MTATLHVLNKAPSHTRAGLCLSAIDDGDTLLLAENGVIGAHDESWLGRVPRNVKVLALGADLAARGLTDHVKKPVHAVDFEGFVDESERCERIIHW